MTQEVLKLSQEALAGLKDVEKQVRELVAENRALKEALAKEKALQALHDENERLGLYKDAYAEPVKWSDYEPDGMHHNKPQKRPQNCGTGYCSCIECVMETPQRTWVGLTDEEIWKFWWSRPEVPEGEDDSMEAEFVAAVRAVLAAHDIKENT